ncbi:hypothetical protein [Methylomonas sp. MgM2]
MNRTRHWLRVLLFSSLTLQSSHAFAVVITDSSLTLSNIQITPTSGSVVFQDPLIAEVFTQAANSMGELDQQYDFSMGGAVSQIAATTWAAGSGQADAAAMTLSATTSVNLTGYNNQASSLGRGSLYGSFMITGGAGVVDVLFSMDVMATLHGYTDAVGSFDPDWTASLFLDFAPNPILFDYDMMIGGSNTPDTVTTVSKTLSNIVNLSFDTPYYIYIEADAESKRNQNLPEPDTLILIMIGLAGFTPLFGRGIKQSVTDDGKV